MPLFRALAKNMAASYFGKKAPYGFVMEVTLLYVFILCQNTMPLLCKIDTGAEGNVIPIST
jgi:hypothetical protein